jgi:hypothetical protein
VVKSSYVFQLASLCVGALFVCSCSPGYKGVVSELSSGLTSTTTVEALRAWAQQEIARAKPDALPKSASIPRPAFGRASPWGEPISVNVNAEKNLVLVIWRHSLANGWLVLEIGPQTYTPTAQQGLYYRQWAPGIWIRTNSKG